MVFLLMSVWEHCGHTVVLVRLSLRGAWAVGSGEGCWTFVGGSGWMLRTGVFGR
jgi:hypothetical protein